MKAILNKLPLLMLLLAGLSSCDHSGKANQQNTTAQQTPVAQQTVIYHGLYSFGPEVKSFKDCANGQEYWAADSSAKLELSYSQLNFEKPYTPVYVEVEGRKVPSGKDGISTEFDSTLVVTKLIKITQEIPAGCQATKTN